MIDGVALSYGALALAAIIATMVAGNRALILTSLIMGASWAVSNWAVATLGFQNAPLIVPEADAILAVILAYVAIGTRCQVATAVFALFVLEGAVHVTFVVIRHSSSLEYIVTLNAIFAMQVVLTGMAGVRKRMVDRVSRGRGGIYRVGRRRWGSLEGVARKA